MRRSDREIKEFKEIVKVMEKCDVCRLALNDKEFPYIIPLNFGMQVMEGTITLYFHGANVGKKYDLIAQNNKASFEMDCTYRLITEEETGNCTMEYESVIGNGLIEIVDDNEKYDALCILMKHYHKENFAFNKAIVPNTKVFKMVVNEIAGKARIINK